MRKLNSGDSIELSKNDQTLMGDGISAVIDALSVYQMKNEDKLLKMPIGTDNSMLFILTYVMADLIVFAAVREKQKIEDIKKHVMASIFGEIDRLYEKELAKDGASIPPV
jgi:hypothetical protein